MKSKKPSIVSAPNIIEADGEINLPLDEAAVLKTAMEELNSVVVGREDEVTALCYCLATGHHLMLEGEPGVAKSMFAREAFKRIESDRVFARQFMKGTQLDEIFGPMNSTRYREEAVWEYNITGQLPDSELAFLDEVYRASDSALPAMLQILNERTFNNGTVKVECPLHTAIGTTNFVTESEELRAFHDRWLIRMRVSPLDSTPAKVKMLRMFIEPVESEVTPVPMDTIRTLSKSVPRVPISEEVLELMVQLADVYRKSLANFPISERRLCQSLLLAQAETLFCGKVEVEAEHLRALKFSLTTSGNKTQTEAFDQAFAAVIGAFIQDAEERTTLKSVSGYCLKLVEAYDAGLSAASKKKLLDKCLQALEGLNNMTPEETPKTRAGMDQVAEIRRKLTEVGETLRLDLGGIKS